MTREGRVVAEPVVQEWCLSWQSRSQCCIKARDYFEFVLGGRLLAGPMFRQSASFPEDA